MVWQSIEQVRAQAPLVHNITNYVVMNSTANALLALGASPVMAHAVEEVEEMAGLASALVLNIGTLSTPWIEAMILAGKEAQRRGIPIVLDPVGAGATRFRTDTALDLMKEVRPAIIRGNASEIQSLLQSGAGARGVDSRHTPDEVLDDAQALAQSEGCVVAVTGPVDLVVAGELVVRVANGHPMMSKVTGMGCAASAFVGAFAAVCSSPLQGASHALAVMGIAGEMAAECSRGPGSFQVNFFDALYAMQKSDVAQRLKMQGLE